MNRKFKFSMAMVEFLPFCFVSAPVGYTKLFEYSTVGYTKLFQSDILNCLSTVHIGFWNLTNVECDIFLYIIITDLLLMVKFFWYRTAPTSIWFRHRVLGIAKMVIHDHWTYFSFFPQLVGTVLHLYSFEWASLSWTYNL